jgi:hypothetical protein
MFAFESQDERISGEGVPVGIELVDMLELITLSSNLNESSNKSVL